MSHRTLPNSGNNKSTRPHSKTIVAGPSIKTRLQCNHLRQKCLSSKKDRQERSCATKRTVPGTASQRRVLCSSRSLPRGETDNRKRYEGIDESVTLCDATWRPGFTTSERKPETHTEGHLCRSVDDLKDTEGHLCRSVDDLKVSKKKIRFEDEVTELEGRQSHDQIINPPKNKIEMPLQNQNRGTFLARQEGPVHATRGSEGSSKESSGDVCTLCDQREKRSYDSRSVTEELTRGSNNDEQSTSHLWSRNNNEVCFLCERSRKHEVTDPDDYCRICDTHILTCGSQDNVERDREYEARRPLASYSAGDGRLVNSPSPNLSCGERSNRKDQQHLQTTDRLQKSSDKKGGMGTHRASGGSQCSSSRDTHPGKKCMHRYQQNDRLFLEPTLTDSKGKSICIDCGARQSSDSEKDPYVYHITLGGMEAAHEKACNNDDSRTRPPHKGKENDARSHGWSRRRGPSDASRLVYAKLNSNIDNVFWKKSDSHSAFSRNSERTSVYTKRHPSRSMALSDHII